MYIVYLVIVKIRTWYKYKTTIGNQTLTIDICFYEISNDKFYETYVFINAFYKAM